MTCRLFIQRALWGGVWLAALVLIPGCVEERVVKQSWGGLRRVADPKPGDGGAGGAAGGGPRTWAIELQRFNGDDKLMEAYAFSRALRETDQVADVWFLNRGDTAVVYTGRFTQPDSDAALDSLKAIRDLRLDGRRAFRNAELVQVERSRGTTDPSDLSQYSGYRSLLLAVYDEEFGPDFRRAAERTLREYRQKHEDLEFYYYHGANQSYVTVGLFTLRGDFIFVDNVEQYGPRIRQVQEIFPYALRNGEHVINPEVAGEDKREPTVIINVP